MRPREPHDWTAGAIAADPAREAFYHIVQVVEGLPRGRQNP